MVWNSSAVPRLMLRNSGMRPMPSGSSRQTSSVTPGRIVGLIMPTTPRQLENAMGEPFGRGSRRGERAATLVSNAAVHRGSRVAASPRCAALRAVLLDERDHRLERLHRIRLERMLVEE